MTASSGDAPRRRRALITGITGQDGAYLARLLIDRGYIVHGTTRDAESAGLGNLAHLGVAQDVHLESMAPQDFRSVLQVVSKTQPDEIYNLAGQSSVGLSFQQPVETLASIGEAVVNLLETIRFLDRPIRLVTAGSGESFGDTGDAPATEDTPYRPTSPYAVAKATARWLVSTYRDSYGLHACTAILFNHESPLRSRRFVTAKIAHGAASIRAAIDRGERPDPLRLGNLSIRRDWGWAPEYMEALHRMATSPRACDYIVATGVSVGLEDVVAAAFSRVGLDWREHVLTDERLLRVNDPRVVRADPSRIARDLGWSAATRMPEVIGCMVDAALALDHPR